MSFVYVICLITKKITIIICRDVKNIRANWEKNKKWISLVISQMGQIFNKNLSIITNLKEQS